MSLASGTKLGPYEIHSSIGAGGMGEVYRARDTRLNRVVAIKVLPASFSADADRLHRFSQEARAAAALNHPNILSVFDVGDGRSPYVVSELLEGETLRELLKNGPLSTRKAIDYGLQVAHGLAAAHEKGIVHRDLKPENLFLTQDGRVKILDFGLAKLASVAAPVDDPNSPTLQAVTEPGLIMGTAGYMSPEQVRGKPTDGRSDIFSFGAVLYEMVSGKKAFHGETAADTMTAILKEDVPDLTESGRNMPPALDRIVRHCLEKNPTQRFQSAGDLAFGLEALTETSTAINPSAVPATRTAKRSFFKAAAIVGAALILLACGGLLWWMRGSGGIDSPEYKQITFNTGSMGNARFARDGSIIYRAAWDGGDDQLYLVRTDDPGSRPIGLKNAEILSISKNGELAIRLNTAQLSGYAKTGTLARVSLNGGSPREVLDNVQDADWAADGENMAVVRFVPETHHWKLEYPIGIVLIDSISWISHPKISPDGKSVAFADHENPDGDDEGSVAIVGADEQEKKLSSGWSSLEGILWSPDGNEVWFSASNSGSSDNLRGVTRSGKLRTIANVPGGMWLEDEQNGRVLIVTNQERLKIRGMGPGAKEEVELGWLGWSYFRDISRDGTKILFEEQADGGGPNYTVFLRNTDGSPPVRMGEGTGRAISPDGKWAITQPLRSNELILVPTGAGTSRRLTHDKINYGVVRFLPDGQHLLASGIEPGHGARDYLIDVGTGHSKPLTPEGMFGVVPSSDGLTTAVIKDGSWGIWRLNESGNGFRPVPNLNTNYQVSGWSTDGQSLLVYPANATKTAKVYRVNIYTGKMEFWKEFGASLEKDAVFVARPTFSADGRAYSYIYNQVLSQSYVVKGLK
jgi:eukaryotic-like serine/threonine-protein kinase